MKRVVMYVLMVVLLCIISACGRTVYVPIQSHRNRIVTVRDTVVELTTAGDTLYNTTFDTVSELHIATASSRASVKNGILQHSLAVAPRRDSVKVQIKEVYIVDSVPYVVPQPPSMVRVTPSWVKWVVIWSLVVTVVVVCLICRAVKKIW